MEKTEVFNQFNGAHGGICHQFYIVLLGAMDKLGIAYFCIGGTKEDTPSA